MREFKYIVWVKLGRNVELKYREQFRLLFRVVVKLSPKCAASLMILT